MHVFPCHVCLVCLASNNFLVVINLTVILRVLKPIHCVASALYSAINAATRFTSRSLMYLRVSPTQIDGNCRKLGDGDSFGAAGGACKGCNRRTASLGLSLC